MSRAESFLHASTDESERGSLSMLIIGLAVILLLIVSVIVAITSIYLDYKKLQDLADQTAISVAHEVRGFSAADTEIVLDDATVQAQSQNFLQVSGAAASFSGLGLGNPTGASTPNTAQVTLVARADIPLLSRVLPASVEITATGAAQTQLNR